MTKEVRWVWCTDCQAWIGAEPPLLPPYWSLDKAAGIHLSANPAHRLLRPTVIDLRNVSSATTCALCVAGTPGRHPDGGGTHLLQEEAATA